MATQKAAWLATSYYLPTQKLTNTQLAIEFGDWGAAKILEKTGIAVRSIAHPDECASDLGVAAAEKLFATQVCSPSEIDFLMFCTQTPDFFMPTTACLIQQRLGLRTDCGALDFNLGCSGFVYGLALAKSLIESGTAGKVLLITAETYSKFINPRDRSVRTIFSDAGAATLFDVLDSEDELIGPFVFGTDGSGGQDLIVRAGAFRCPVNSESDVEKMDRSGNWRSDKDLYMNGPEVFNFTLRAVPEALNNLLAKSGKCIADIDYFIFHQANKFMLDGLREKLGIPGDKFCIDLESYGNTVSSTIPIALANARRSEILKTGDLVAILGFGVGYSWAGALIRIT
ncbi:MAG TPA: ketoacyl-ACP synthase III [Pyrinomonadaceae bacterium]|nr:ketoacyl-ACP synthase III [Pyrinomonadaceae bacterium]